MNIYHQYSVTWRYEFNHLKSGVVTFGEDKSVHSQLLMEREWLLGETTVNELCEYKNPGVLKNYIGSFSSNIEDNIEKTCKKAGMIFFSDFDRCKTNPLVYIKFWRQACLPCLLFGTKLFSLNGSQLGKLERCQQWFLKNVFHVPKFAAGKLLLRLANLNSTESEIDLKKLLVLGRLIGETKMPDVVKGLFQCRADDFFNSSLTSMGVLPGICDAPCKYDLFHYLQFWHRYLSFPTYTQWKSIVKTKIREKDNDDWLSYCQDHPGMHVVQACLLNTPPCQFWSLADDYPDLVSRLHIQVRIMRNFGFIGGVPWLSHTQGALCFICKEMSRM